MHEIRIQMCIINEPLVRHSHNSQSCTVLTHTCTHTDTQSPRLTDPQPWSLTVCSDGDVMAKWGVAVWVLLEMVEIITVASGWEDLSSRHHGKWDKLLLSVRKRAHFIVYTSSDAILNLALLFWHNLTLKNDQIEWLQNKGRGVWSDQKLWCVWELVHVGNGQQRDAPWVWKHYPACSTWLIR